MARIRTIKPEFWTDEKIVTLSFASRLLYIGMWNFVDDDGRGEFSPTRLKMQILPADPIDVSELIGELRRENLIELYEADNTAYFRIRSWHKHQKVDNRSKSRCPAPPGTPPNPPDIHLALAKTRRGKGKGKGKGKGEVQDAPKYVFDGVVIHLVKKHFDAWEKAFSNLNLDAELIARDAYLASDKATDENRKEWFISTSRYFANMNGETKMQASLPPAVSVDISGAPLGEI